MSTILGISSYYHDSACCLIQDGHIIAAAEEERFTRIKHDKNFPINALNFCLKEAYISIDKVDIIAFYENPFKKFYREVSIYNNSTDNKFKEYLISQMNPYKFYQDIRDKVGYKGKIRYVDHHLSHAASSFYYSGFKEASILVADGVGEWACTSLGVGTGKNINLYRQYNFPHSLGLLYSAFTSYLGFEVNEGEYKVMGLAAFGKPIFKDILKHLINFNKDSDYFLNMEYFNFTNTRYMYNKKFISLLGQPMRSSDGPITSFHKDVAASLQYILEKILILLVKKLYNDHPSQNLCIAGGVGLNAVANSKILKHTPFKNLFVQPAASDAGGALGAAMYLYVQSSGKNLYKKMKHVYLGTSYKNEYIESILKSLGIPFQNYKNRFKEQSNVIVDQLIERKVIGWFQGKMEFGPRALGNRSILADPRDPNIKEAINMKIKKREDFRPFAPSILEKYKNNFFTIDHASPFMTEVVKVKSPIDLPAITHVDNTARIQTVDITNKKYYELLSAFYAKTNCPIFLNTSFNMSGEPIVCTPFDALKTFIISEIDVLAIESCVIFQKDIPKDLKLELKLYLSSMNEVSNINYNVYAMF